MHLRYDLMTAQLECSLVEHPQSVMKQLGIIYQKAVPQSIANQWWFWNCENVPDPLPRYLSKLNVEPERAIGWGLSREDAAEIIAYADVPNRILGKARALIAEAQRNGLVLTIETVPAKPLAMGNYDVVAQVRGDHGSYR